MSTTIEEYLESEMEVIQRDFPAGSPIRDVDDLESSFPPLPPTSSYIQVYEAQPLNLNNDQSEDKAATGIQTGKHKGNDDKKGYGKDINDCYQPLYRAAVEGDWEKAKEFLDMDPDAVTAGITMFSETALHVAAREGHSIFVEELVNLMPLEALKIRESMNGDTALHTAAISGNTEAAKAMVNKNPDLTQLGNGYGWIPLISVVYASHQQKKMMEYLCTVTRDVEPHSPFSGRLGARLICNITRAGFYDIAFFLIEKYPTLAMEKDEDGTCALQVMAEMPYAFLSGSPQRPLQRYIHSVLYNEQICEEKVMQGQALALVKCICEQISHKTSSEISEFFKDSSIFMVATVYGTVELIVECIQAFPDLIWLKMMGHNIFEIAIEERHEKIFNLVLKMNEHKEKLAYLRDDSGNNILHLAAKLSPSSHLHSVSCVALQMRKELQWFKMVESITLPINKVTRNNDGKTPRVLFTEQHQDLMEKGEKWMKDTANSCMLVATLIATVVFAAAFTVPGGYYSDSDTTKKGIPIFLHKNFFMVFVLSDAIALFSSSTSILMFLSILTSRYAEEDFLESLPKRLLIGLGTLFISIVAMMVAFTATLTIVLGPKFRWISIPMGLIACVPATLFQFLHSKLLFEIFTSTYGIGIFGK